MSIKNTGKGVLLWEFVIIKGSDQIHIPFVQGLNVGPTPKPLICFFSNKTLFNKNDFPVRYFPTKLIIPIFSWFWFNKSWRASSGIINLLSLKDIKGRAVCLGIVIFWGFFKFLICDWSSKELESDKDWLFSLIFLKMENS